MALALIACLTGTAAAQGCPGDCNGNGVISISELVRGVAIALDPSRAPICPALDPDQNGGVTVNELVQANRGAAGLGCQQQAPRAPIGPMILEIGTDQVSAGGTASIDVTLRQNGQQVVATENEIDADPFGPLCFQGCTVNPVINRGSGGFNIRSCSNLKALILSFANLTPIPDGSVLYRCDVSVAPGTPPGFYEMTISAALGSDSVGNGIPGIGVAGGIFVGGVSASCGDGVVESDETCDDGNTHGGDGCASNCTIEDVRPFLFTTEASPGNVQIFSTESGLSISAGQLVMHTGTARPSAGSGEIPVVISPGPLFGATQLPVTGTPLICVRAIEDATYGPGNAGEGTIGCGSGGLSGTDHLFTRESGGASIGQRSGSGPRGSAFIEVTLGVDYIVGGNGADGAPCSGDESIVRSDFMPTALTTGTSIAEIGNSTIAVGPLAGFPFNCDAIATAPGAGVDDAGLTLGFATDMSPVHLAAVVRLGSVEVPTPSPTATNTRTPTVTRTPTRTRTRSFTPTPTPTATIPLAPISLILQKVKLEANTTSRPGRRNGTARINAVVNANPPFADLISDITTGGLYLVITGDGINFTLGWNVSDCTVVERARGPRISCATEDAVGKRKLRLRATSTPNLFDLSVRGNKLGLLPPLLANILTVSLRTNSFERQDQISSCISRGDQDQRLTCRETGFVLPPTPTPTPVPLGERVFSIARPGSDLLTTTIPGVDVTVDPWLSGPMRLVAGPVGDDGLASLSLAQDFIYGAEIIDGSTFCVKVFAAGSSGSIDCDGGTPQSALVEFIDTFGPEERFTGLGSDSGPGAALLLVQHSPTLLGRGTTVADCASQPFAGRFNAVYTTDTITGTILNPVPPGPPLSLSGSGRNFDCGSWTTEDGPGSMVTVFSASFGGLGSVMTVTKITDQATGPTPTPVLSPTPTPTPGGIPLGLRTFSLSRPGSLYLGANGPDISQDPWLTGPLVLSAGPVGTDGVAALTVQSEAIYGFGLGTGTAASVLCVKIEAAGSSGSIDCDGGSPYSSVLSQDSNGAGAADPPVFTLNIGPDSGAGAAGIVVQQSVLALPTGTAAACLTATYPPATAAFYTTDEGTATVAEPIQGGSMQRTVTGSRFECGTWTVENGPGRLVGPRIELDTPLGDQARIFLLDD